MAAGRVVRVNERGLRIGEDHQRAKLTDHEVELLLRLHALGWTYADLGRKFEVSKSYARKLCIGAKRTQTCAGHRVVSLPRR